MLRFLQTPVQRQVIDEGASIDDLQAFLARAREDLQEELQGELQEELANDEFVMNSDQIQRMDHFFTVRFYAPEEFEYEDCISDACDMVLYQLKGQAMVVDESLLSNPSAPVNLGISLPDSAWLYSANVLFRSMDMNEYQAVVAHRTLTSSGSFYSPNMSYSLKYLDRGEYDVLVGFYFDDTIGNILATAAPRDVHMQNAVDGQDGVHFRSAGSKPKLSKFQLKSEDNPKVVNLQVGRKEFPRKKDIPSGWTVEKSTAMIQVGRNNWAVEELSRHLIVIKTLQLSKKRQRAGRVRAAAPTQSLGDVWTQQDVDRRMMTEQGVIVPPSGPSVLPPEPSVPLPGPPVLPPGPSVPPSGPSILPPEPIVPSPGPSVPPPAQKEADFDGIIKAELEEEEG